MNGSRFGVAKSPPDRLAHARIVSLYSPDVASSRSARRGSVWDEAAAGETPVLWQHQGEQPNQRLGMKKLVPPRKEWVSSCQGLVRINVQSHLSSGC